jgi:hypothetical protein
MNTYIFTTNTGELIEIQADNLDKAKIKLVSVLMEWGYIEPDVKTK